MRSRSRTLFGIAATLTLSAIAGASVPASSPQPAGASAFAAQSWQRDLSARIVLSSPTIADLNGDGSNEIIVGDLEGWVHAYRGDGRGELPGWPQQAKVDGVHATAVESSPAVADLDHDGKLEVIVGATSVWAPNQQGGLIVFNADGSTRWRWRGTDYITIWGQTSFRHDGYSEGAVVAPAIGDIDGDHYPDIVFGTFEAKIHAFNRFGHELKGFPYQADDTVWSSASLYDVNHDGRMEIFVGSPSTGGGPQPHMGGTMFGLSYAHGRVNTMWRNNIAESIDASPAITDLDGDGRMEVVTTTGWAFQNAHSRMIWAWHLDNGSPVRGWPVDTGSITPASVAIGDLDRDGNPEVVVGSWDGHVRAYHGNGRLMWNADAFAGSRNRARIEAAPVIADLNGDGIQDVVVPTDVSVVLMRGQDGRQMTPVPIGRQYGYFSSPAVGFLNGEWSLVVTGFRGGYPQTESDPAAVGRITVYSFGSTPFTADWPMFRRNPERDGAAYNAAGRSPAWRCRSTPTRRGRNSTGTGAGSLTHSKISTSKLCGGTKTRSV